jgi:repressor LexA
MTKSRTKAVEGKKSQKLSALPATVQPSVGSGLTPKQKTLWDFVRGFSEKHGYMPSQQEIADHFGFSSLGTVQNYLVRLERMGMIQKEWNSKRGMKIVDHRVDGVESSKIKNISELREKLTDQIVRLPLVGQVAAGRPIEAIEHREMMEIPASLTQKAGPHFVLKVKGDSMIGDGILDGDYVIIRQQPSASNGQTVVALVDHHATIKRFYQRKNSVELHAANPQFEPMIFSDTEVRSRGFRIEGILTGVLRRF